MRKSSLQMALFAVFAVSVFLTVISARSRSVHQANVDAARVALGEVSQRITRARQFISDLRGGQGLAALPDLIASTSSVDRGGRLKIERLPADAEPMTDGLRYDTDELGRRVLVLEANCEGYKVSVSIPENAARLTGSEAFNALFVLDLVLFLMMFSAIPSIWRGIRRDIGSIVTVFRKGVLMGNASSLKSAVLSPLTLVAMALLVAILVGLYVVASRQALSAARERLSKAAEDIVVDLEDCVGKQLAFIGKTICDRYRSPERMKGVDFKVMLAAYGLDELNAIDGRGIIVESSLPIVGDDQWKKANPAKFNRALLKEGRKTFAQNFRPSADEPGVYYKYVGVAFPPPAKGYLQLGFRRARLRDSIDYSLRDLVQNWHIGESGFYVISKTLNGEILSCGRENCQGKTFGDVGFDIFRARRMANTERREAVSHDFLGFSDMQFFTAGFNGERCLCTTGVVNQFHRYVALIPYSEILGPVTRMVVLIGVLLFLVFALAVFFFSRLSDKNRALEVFIARDREQREKDLAVATTIQTSSLPAVFPNNECWKIYAQMCTAREVGGDFYDFSVLADGRVFFLVADVSGKGIPAAMFMMKAKTTLRGCILTATDLAEAVAAANDRLAEQNDANMFVTAWIGIFNPESGEVTYVNAGHNPPLIRRADGSVEWVRGKRGLVLAAMGGVPYRVATLSLNRGDSLCLYTDGVTEANNPAFELYGESRLEAALKAAGPHYVDEIRHSVSAFADGAEQADDITLLALDYKPSNQK